MTARRFPMQPVMVDRRGVARFAENQVVRHLLDQSGLSLDDVLAGNHPIGDVTQFYQLLGYTVDGFCDLTTVEASAKWPALQAARAALESAVGQLHWRRVEAGWYQCRHGGLLLELRLRREPCAGTYRLGGREACKLPWLCHDDPATSVMGLSWVALHDGRPITLPGGGSIPGVAKSLNDGKLRVRQWCVARQAPR